MIANRNEWYSPQMYCNQYEGVLWSACGIILLHQDNIVWFLVKFVIIFYS